MASIINVIGKIFGSKADKDLKQLAPYLERIKKEYDRIDKLDHDALRAETLKIKQTIQDYITEDEKQKAILREQLEDVEIEVLKKEALATEVDKLTKKIDEKIEEILDRVLPQDLLYLFIDLFGEFVSKALFPEPDPDCDSYRL